MLKKILFIGCLIGLMLLKTNQVRGQAALLVLIFGDKVATENFHFSLKAGANVANQNGFDDSKRLNGFNFGLVSSVKINDKWYFEPEFLPLSPRGVRGAPVLETGNPTIDPALTNQHSTKRTINYIDIPIMVRYYVSQKISIAGGPYVSFLSSAEDEFKTTDLGDVLLSTDIKSKLNSIDYGACIEISYSLWEARKGKGINVYARYSHGLADVYKADYAGSHQNSVWQFGAVLPFIHVDE